MKKLKTCVFSAIVLLVISFRDEAESKPVEFPQEREISLKKEMEIVRRLKRYMEKNDDFIEKFHSGKMSRRSNLDPNSRFQRSDPLDGPLKRRSILRQLNGPPPAKEAKTSVTHKHPIKKDPHPPDGKQKIPSRNNGHAHKEHGNGGHTCHMCGGMEQTNTHKKLTKVYASRSVPMPDDSLKPFYPPTGTNVDSKDPDPEDMDWTSTGQGHGNGKGIERTSMHKQLKKKNDDFIEKSHSGKSSKRSNMAEELRLGTSLNQAEASQDQAI